MELYQGPGLYKREREIYKKPTKIIVKEKKGLKQSIKEYWETIYYNTILVGLILEKYIGVKNIKVNLGKRNLSYSIVNIIGGKYLKALNRPNKSGKYNSNTPKNKNNKVKKLALLSRCFSKQPKI